MKHVSRRSFIVNTATLTALDPIVSVLEGCKSGDETLSFLESAEQIRRLLDPNGLNLAFYFINTKDDGKVIIPDDASKRSYMIVQLPPQSMHEQSSPNPFTTQASAQLSLHSYLAFKLVAPLNSMRRQELKYQWKTEKFKKANLGIIRFNPETNPKTAMSRNEKRIPKFDITPNDPGLQLNIINNL